MDTPCPQRPDLPGSSGSSTVVDEDILWTVRILAPLSGNVLAIYNHYAYVDCWEEEYLDNPHTIDLALAVRKAHPPPDENHSWILVDPDTMQEMPGDSTPYTKETVYAILRDCRSDRQSSVTATTR